jgi:hypothetical protein
MSCCFGLVLLCVEVCTVGDAAAPHKGHFCQAEPQADWRPTCRPICTFTHVLCSLRVSAAVQNVPTAIADGSTWHNRRWVNLAEVLQSVSAEKVRGVGAALPRVATGWVCNETLGCCCSGLPAKH